MKKMILSCTVLAFLVLAAASCSKKDDNTTVTPGGGTGTATTYPDTVTASNYGFDGTGAAAFSSIGTDGIVQSATGLTITAVKTGTTEAITISLTGTADTGIYYLDKGNAAGNLATLTKDNTKPTDGALNYRTDGNEAVTNNIGGGKVTITSITATDIAGIFYIIAYNNAGSAAFAEQGTFKGKIKK